MRCPNIDIPVEVFKDTEDLIKEIAEIIGIASEEDPLMMEVVKIAGKPVAEYADAVLKIAYTK